MPLPGMLQKRSLNDLEVNMPSLLDAAEAFSKLGKKSVEIDQAACVRVRHRHASCMACFQVCAHEAIARDDDGLLAIDNHLCTGCGACASVCPTSALQLVEDVPELVRAAIESIAEQADALQDDTDPSSADSLRTEKPCGTLTISCEYLRNQEAALEERAHSEAGLRVKASPDEIDPPKAKTEHEAECSLTLSCLAALDEAALISAACSNVEVRYESGDCACCPNAQGELIATLGEQATRFLGAFLAAATPERPLPAARALPAAWSLVTPNDAESATTNTSPELSRRGLFDHFIERTTDSIAEAAVGTFYVSTTAQDQKRTLAQRLFADKGILKHIEAVRNERVLNELYRFDPEWADQILPEKEDAELPTRLFGEVTVDETACDLCGICMTFCPTGALSGVANEPVNSFVMLNRDIAPKGELSFRANDCMACQLCTDICPHDALELQRGIRECDLFALEPRTLIKR
ncbi:MAG: 4Fe-4S binding protein [Eggerthellaceae bacterium]|nr:4Fe-4S binding protein [Eggerthellaceae bacterium]